MTIQTIFILGLPPAKLDRSRSWTYDKEEPAGYRYAHSEVLVCPRCLVQWAVLSFGEPEHHVQAAWCERCEPVKREFHPGLIPGSILGGFILDEPLLNVLPENLLRREVKLHLREYERRQQHAMA